MWGSGNIVFDNAGRPCRAWRPTQAPPPPSRPHAQRTHGSKAGVSPTNGEIIQSSEESSMITSRNAREVAGEPQTRSGLAQGAMAVVPGCRDVTAVAEHPSRPLQPPVGQLLPRGKDGIDGVLHMAREAENLFRKLQARRLRREEKVRQQQLTKDLDSQREYNRMQELAAYQEELVNMFGPTMKHVIADTFFDDGSDPVLSYMRGQRASMEGDKTNEQVDVQAAWRLATVQHERRERGVPTMIRAGGAAETRVVATTGIDRSPPWVRQVVRERETLHTALDARRAGRRRPF